MSPQPLTRRALRWLSQTGLYRALCDRFVVTHHPDGWLKRLD